MNMLVSCALKIFLRPPFTASTARSLVVVKMKTAFAAAGGGNGAFALVDGAAAAAVADDVAGRVGESLRTEWIAVVLHPRASVTLASA